VLTPERLAEIWRVDARLDVQGDHTALHVSWLERAR
jgi:hypothetical protein